MRLLDLFCGAGGAAMGYHRAGFDVVGVDIVDQPHYPFDFHRADALDFPLDGFDVVHASPPCQGYTTMTNRRGSTAPLLIHVLRERLAAVVHVIENVTGARPAMRSPILLHGGMFGLGVWRPRLFESNVELTAPAKAPRPSPCVAVYGHEYGRDLWRRKDGTMLRSAKLPEASAAMGVEWMTYRELTQAIPPAYTEHIGRQL